MYILFFVVIQSSVSIPEVTCVSAGTLASFGQSAAGTTAPPGAVTSSGGVTSSGSTASSLLRTLSRRRRRSSASATMTSSSSSSSSSSLIPQQYDVSDDSRRVQEPASVFGSTSAFTSISGHQCVEEVEDTVERMATGKLQRLKPLSTHRYVGSTSTSPSDVEHILFTQSSAHIHTQSVGVPRSSDDRPVVRATSRSAASLYQHPRQRLELPVTSLPLPLYAESRDTQEVMSSERQRARLTSVPTCVTPTYPQLPRCRQNGNGATSWSVAGRSSSFERSGVWTSDERRLGMCESEPSTTTTTTTTTTSAAGDVWRPY